MNHRRRTIISTKQLESSRYQCRYFGAGAKLHPEHDEIRRPPCKIGVVVSWLRRMPSITLKDIPVELHAQLKNEAAVNFRSITQEAMSRIERMFQIIWW
jgi:hypothetical protein